MKTVNKVLTKIIYPLILLLYPLTMIRQGADLSDTTYSLGNYLFFEDMTGGWKYATFFANVLGRGLIAITGGRMLYMNLAACLLISAMALVIYYFLIRKMNPLWIFLGELVALGLCWCPTAILYNYLTYFFLTGAVLLILLALEKEKPLFLLFAGILLGLNVLVRASNLTQMALILVVWFDLYLKKNRKIWKETGTCILGYVIGLLIGIGAMLISGGSKGYLEMMSWLASLLTSEGDAGGYSLSAMLMTILTNYIGNLKWFAMLVGGTLLGVLGFSVWKEKLVLLKKIGFTLCVLILFVYFYRNGMFTNQYYNVGSIFCPAVVFILLTIGLDIYMLFNKKAENWTKCYSMMSLVLILILPLGSNNHLYSIINYLLFVAPVAFALIGNLLKENGKNEKVFPAIVMCIVFGMMLLVQTILFHNTYVFCDGNSGEKRSTYLVSDTPMKGMKTNAIHAKAMEELYDFAAQNGLQKHQLLLLGNIPGVSYYLQMHSAISTTWPDLDSYAVASFEEEIEELSRKKGEPVVILNKEYGELLQVMLSLDGASDNYNENDITANSFEKLNDNMQQKCLLLKNYLQVNGYEATFANEEFVIFEIQ